jgi:hypothetical protein
LLSSVSSWAAGGEDTRFSPAVEVRESVPLVVMLEVCETVEVVVAAFMDSDGGCRRL